MLVSGAPKNLFTKKEYMGRCVPVVAVTGDQTVAQLTNTAMSQCEQELVQYNGTDKAKNMICLVYAKNDQRMPWVAEMQAAWKEGRRTDAENDRIIELAISSTTNAMSLKTPDSRYIPVSK